MLMAIYSISMSPILSENKTRVSVFFSGDKARVVFGTGVQI